MSVFLREPIKGIFSAFFEIINTKKTNGINAPLVPMKMSRKGFLVKGKSLIFHIHAKNKANVNTIPSAIMAKVKSLYRE